MKLLLPPIMVIIAVVLALAWHAIMREAPLSVAQQCLLVSEGYIHVSPVKLSSRMGSGKNILLIKADFGKKMEPRYGTCVVSGKGIDGEATSLNIVRLIETSSERCLKSSVFYCKVGGRGHCHRAYQAWRDPTPTEVEKRRQTGVCGRLDRDSSLVKAELERRYHAILGAEHVETW